MSPEASPSDALQLLIDQENIVCGLGERHAALVGTRKCGFDGVLGCSVDPEATHFCPVNDFWEKKGHQGDTDEA